MNHLGFSETSHIVTGSLITIAIMTIKKYTKILLIFIKWSENCGSTSRHIIYFKDKEKEEYIYFSSNPLF